MDMQSAMKALADGDVIDADEVRNRIGNPGDGNGGTPTDADEHEQLVVDLG